MAYDGNGVFVIDTAGQPVVGGTTISSTVFNALTADLANGLTLAITKDGQSTTTNPIPFDAGIETDTVDELTPGSGAAIKGCGDNSTASSGFVGEYISATGTINPLVSATNTDICSIALTAGDWDVSALGQFGGSVTAAVRAGYISVSTASTVPDAAFDRIAYFGSGTAPFSDSGAIGPSIPSARFSLAAPATVFLIGFMNFTSTALVSGALHARRVR